jgi:Leucine-rich repeat (LRR) protein
MKLIGQMPNLEVLTLWETKLNDDALNEFGGLSKLKALNLKATTITDESIDTLMKLQNLEDLTVAGTQLSDDSFRKLGTLPKLKKLNVANTSIGFDVIDELAESNKALEVIEFEN